MSVKHIIFDCDGVLVDSEPLSMRADVALLKQFGIEMSEAEAHARFVGTTFEAMLVNMTREFGVTFPSGLHAEKSRMVAELYRAELRMVDGVGGILQQLAARGLTFSVASNSPKSRVELALQLTSLAPHFNSITTFEDVAYGKPEPDVFLRAAELAGVGRNECLVVEDSVTGVTAAIAANIRTFGFTGVHPEPAPHGKVLLTYGAAKVFSRMTDLPQLLS